MILGFTYLTFNKIKNDEDKKKKQLQPNKKSEKKCIETLRTGVCMIR